MYAAPEVAYAAIATLIALSYVTILSCRLKKVGQSRSFEEFLFNGVGYWHSVVSNVGATFSTTYFFGGVMILGKILGSWTAAALGLAFGATILIYWRILRIADSYSSEIPADRTNLLLWILKKNEPLAFKSLVAVYAFTYFSLLVQEIAVSRAVLDSILVGRPQIAGAATTILLLVVIAYLYTGGFRAVLVSDFVQAVVLSCFLFMLVHLAITKPAVGSATTDPPPAVVALNLMSATVIGAAWFVASIDFASRLNIDSPRENPAALSRQRLSLVAISLLAISILLLVGVLFSRTAYSVGAEKLLPQEYLLALSRYFLNDTPMLFRVVFLVSVFCMIFTTIDTICLALLQTGYFLPEVNFSRRSPIALLLLASLFAGLIDIDRLYISGVFAASLMVLPMGHIIRAIFPAAKRHLPAGAIHVWAAFGVTVIAYFSLGESLEGEYLYQFLIPLIPVSIMFMLIMSHVAARGAKLLWLRTRSRR